MRIEDLQAQVDAHWAERDLPSWPSPRPAMDPPRDEEYSRVSDPARYRIVHERARAWTELLSELPGVRSESMPSAPLDANGRLGSFDRGTRLTSDREGTLPLLLLERDAAITDHAGSDGGPTLAVLHLAVAEPTVELAFHPDCGCDACDWGSADLLEAIDEAVRHVVAGPLVILEGPRWQAQWHPDGGSSGGAGRGPDHDRVMELCRRLTEGEDVRLPRRTRAFVGSSWLP